MKENIITGKKYRIVNNAAQDVWDRISFWTKASDVYYNDNTSAEANKPLNILQRSRAYKLGDIAYESTAPSWVMLKCTTAGTTAATTPSVYSSIASAGTIVTDGTAKFTVYDVRPHSELSNNSCEVPTMNLVNDLSGQLTANGKSFQFAYDSTKQKYGFSVDGVVTPFGKGDEIANTDFEMLSDSNTKNASVPHYGTKDKPFIVPTTGTYLIWLETGKIDHVEERYVSQSHTIYVNDVPISSTFYSRFITASRTSSSEQYYGARTTITFANLTAGDVVKGYNKSGDGGTSWQYLTIWRLNPQ